MAISNIYLTANEIANRHKNAQGEVELAKMLVELSDFIGKMPMFPANDGWDHKSSQVTYKPTPTAYSLNEGVNPDAGKTKQVVDGVAMFMDVSQVHFKVAENPYASVEETRQTEAEIHMAGFAEEQERLCIYGNAATNPKEFTGIMRRYNAIEADAVVNNGSTTGSVTSIYAVGFGKMGLHGIYPAGTIAGLKREDEGKIWTLGPDSKNSYYYVETLGWDFGMAVVDPRSVKRLANINPTYGGTADFDENNLLDTLCLIPKNLGLNWWLLMHPKIKLQMRKVLTASSNFQRETLDGIPVDTFDGIPIITSEKVLLTESVIS